MRDYEPNLRVRYGRQDFINLLKRAFNPKDKSYNLKKVLKKTRRCTKNNSRFYEKHIKRVKTLNNKQEEC